MKGPIPNTDYIGSVTRNEMFENSMPDMTYVKETIATAHTLTFQTGHCIDKLSDEFEGRGKKSYKKFLIRLDEIGDQIEERNKQSEKKKMAVYPYLHPSVVPASIDI